MHADIPTFRIPVEGARIDPVRDTKRIMIEVATDSTNGCSVGGGTSEANRGGHHRVPPPRIDEDGIHPSVVRFEIYADNLDSVRARVRTEKHVEALRQASEAAEIAQQAWLNEEVRPSEQARLKSMAATDGRGGTRLDELIRRRCPTTKWSILSEHTPYRTGIPPLIYLKVVDRDGIACDLGEYEKDPQRFLIDAPHTPINATRLANEHLAATMAEAIGRATGGASSPEIARLSAENEQLKQQLSRIEQMLEKRNKQDR